MKKKKNRLRNDTATWKYFMYMFISGITAGLLVVLYNYGLRLFFSDTIFRDWLWQQNDVVFLFGWFGLLLFFELKHKLYCIPPAEQDEIPVWKTRRHGWFMYHSLSLSVAVLLINAIWNRIL